MFKHILANADINWMAIFALVTFFAMFIVVVIALFTTDKDHIRRMANLPMEDDPAEGNRE